MTTIIDQDHNKGFSSEELKRFVSRMDVLDEERKGIADDIKDLYTELKGKGFDVKTLRKVYARHKMDKAEREEADALLELYESVFGD